MGVRVSVLDTSPIVRGSTAREALRNTLDLAVLADELGFHRYWVPEHHSMRGVASSAPAVVAGRIAAATERIRVGAGGVLLPNHAPIVVAEQFGTLEAFHPGRIDLGVGRALGGPQHAADAVRSERERTLKTFEEQVAELLRYFSAAGERIRAVPAVGNVPEVWLLGSSGHSAALAGTLGLGYAYAHHLKPADAVDALGRYHGPRTLVSVSAIVADTDEEAEYLAGSTRLKVLSRVRGKRIQLPSPAEAAAYPYTDDDRAEIAVRSGGVLVGSPDTVRELLQAVLAETGTTELMLTTPVYEHAARRRSYELVGKIAPSLG
ncbi:LLM class flavin-dependent oxidoreductase [Kutzneria sp. NPDC051319]|uniref:LLM class flavin-dependent oxidoreductase n=1 Tax=Kutzneria sp. NPDC051319 TaxID=3155047 RepID=UPI003417BCDE